MTDDPYDVEAQEQRERDEQYRETVQRVNEAEDFKWIMSDVRGRRFIWGLLERSGLFSLPYDGTGEGAIRAIEATSEARLVMGLMFALCPDAFMTMIKEHENGDGQPD